MSGKIENNSRSHIYDKMFKKVLTLSSKAVINFINGLFETEYSTDAMFVEGVYKKNRRAEQALYHLCKEYFDKKFDQVIITKTV